MRGPARYYLRFAKNNSKNAVVAGIFLDKLIGPVSPFDKLPMVFMGIIHFDPPNPDATGQTSAANAAVSSARSLWSALSAAQAEQGGAALLTPYRTLALRFAQVSGGTDALLQNWRWTLNLWVGDDHQTFLNYMRAAYGTTQVQISRPIDR